MLVRLLYASRASEEMNESLLASILSQSFRNNAEQGITGLLCAHMEEGTFLQALEGGRDAVNRLYGRIVGDPRHCDATLLGFEEIEERRFASWRMGIVTLDKINRASILRYTERASLDASSLSGRSALGLLEELAETASILGGEGA